ncbi:MAG TPA: glycine--tRNA ligase subunit beta [Azospirillaceae bacterium]|nr:glycine--tRNA ligase subunit beta [Azospirillaceae bacterium]
MSEFLLELRSEDIPARMQARAAEDLKGLVLDGLKAAGLEWSSASAHATPRRLAVVVDGLPARTADVREERRGPRDGAPEQAIQGFLKANGLTRLDQCEKRDTGKGVFWFAHIDRPGRATADILAGVIGDAVLRMPWPKSMRFGHSMLAWVRPLQSILAVFDGVAVPGALALGDYVAGRAARLLAPGETAPEGEAVIAFGDQTVGHRFLSPEAFAVRNFAEYRDGLRRAHVILDREARKALIREDAERLAKAEGLTVAPDDGLLEEVAGLVEWPVVLLGGFDPAFLEVPPEVLTTSMRVNQKYFALLRPDGTLSNRFVIVANRPTRDDGATVVGGNERVLRARLSDAQFFWEQDKKVRLEDRVPALGAVTFHAKLGTVEEKVRRMQTLAVELAAFVPGADADRAKRAAWLAKADLTSGMVGEFPELQGLMGRYYALAQGEAPEVADAVADHYKPLGPNDRCPTAPVSVAVALADKIDTLVGFFAIDEKPTGSKDPYALRRAALGVIRLVVENRLRIGLNTPFAAALDLYRRTGADPVAVRRDLLDFFADRLKVALREKGVRHDLIDAVFALGGEDDLVRLLARVDALQAFLGTPDGQNLLTAYKRAANIVRIEEKKDGREYHEVNARSFTQAEEEALWAKLLSVRGELKGALDREEFMGGMGMLASLRLPVDQFFDRVTVNVEDTGIRCNRLALLRGIMATMRQVADFSRVEG